MLMDLDLAIAKHSEWKSRLLAAITNNETLATATMAKDSCCALGKWLHGNPLRSIRGYAQTHQVQFMKHPR